MNQKPVVALFSEANFFGIELLKNLLANFCDVIIFTSDKNQWEQKTQYAANSSCFRIVEEKNFSFNYPIAYAVFCQGFSGQKNLYAKFNYFYKRYGFAKIKSVVIFPAEAFDFDESPNLPLNDNLLVVYLTDLFGPGINLEAPLRFNRVLEEITMKSSLTVGVGEVFYPLFAPLAAKQICRWIFSFGPYGKEIFLMGEEISATSFWKQIIKILPDTRLYYDKAISPFVVPGGYARKVIDLNLLPSLRETFNHLSKRNARNVFYQKANKYPKIFLGIFISFLLFPVFNLLVSAALLYASYRSYLAGKTNLTQNLLVGSRVPVSAGKIFAFYSDELTYGFYLAGRIIDIGLYSLKATENIEKFTVKIFGNEVYNPENLAQALDDSLRHLYQFISQIETETKRWSQAQSILARQVSQKIDFEKLRKLIFAASGISQELPEILGADRKKTYLFLFQNNMELRPAGGFIGSFALVAFEGGRIVDFSVSDVYSADGQLKGHVEPPAPLKKYLGEANWFFRDSNWDPDFPTSAKRAEWFIDKEIDQKVDGVIGIDLYPVKGILEIIGPVYLADYDIEISSQNLYEKTQEEVEENFFAGSQKKKSFLTALSRNIIFELEKSEVHQKIGIVKILLENLEKRHVQIFLHDQKVQNQISEMGWAGEAVRRSCWDGCYADFLGLVEANVGVNKANYFVERHQDLTVKVLPNKVERELALTFENSANPSLGLRANYKAYVRVLVPADAEVQGNFEVSEVRGLKEIGFLLEAPPGTRQRVILSWSSAAATKDYGVFVRKQAGISENGNLSVVVNGNLLYNAPLQTDLWMLKP